jgi:hypothetical protein
MILYVNGDSHSAGAEAVNHHCFAEDDSKLWPMGRRPHPDNLAVSYGQKLADKLCATLECQAESAGSNDRIIRTTLEYLAEHNPDLIVIGWSTWEREEWLHDGIYYQVTASGTDSVPKELQQRYKQWVIEQDYVSRQQKLLSWHDKIYQFHLSLNDRGIKHLFFNTYSNFSVIRTKQIMTNVQQITPDESDWGQSYIDPYSENLTYYFWLKNLGFKTVNENSYHYGADAHSKWADFLYGHLTS